MLRADAEAKARKSSIGHAGAGLSRAAPVSRFLGRRDSLHTTPCIGWYLIFTDIAKGNVAWGIALLR
jgi:hypothetical protein